MTGAILGLKFFQPCLHTPEDLANHFETSGNKQYREWSESF